MPMPQAYFDASRDFDAFILDVRDTCLLQTHHQAYHTLRAVLHVFRDHLAVEDALRFASVLPPLVRAIFVEDWVPSPPRAFPHRAALQAEVKAVRPDHNLAPDTAISDVATALRRSRIDIRELDRVLAGLPDGARDYWSVDNDA